MKNFYGGLLALLLTTFLTAPLAGCGNSGGTTQPAPGNFPNKELLASTAAVDPSAAILLDARYSGEASGYAYGHIPGAIDANPSLFSTNSGDVLKSDSELRNVLGGMGISCDNPDKTIIIYDDTTESLGAGGRLFWMLEYLGCTNVTVLNGGWDEWILQGGIPVTDATTLTPVNFTGEVNSSIFITTQELAIKLSDPAADFVLVDVRTPGEYDGTHPSAEDTRPGHISGAINIPYTKCFDPEYETVVDYDGLKKLLADNGITKETEVVAYSTVGKRSGFFYYICRLMGYKVTNYVGSIVEWGTANLADPVTYPMVPEITP